MMNPIHKLKKQKTNKASKLIQQSRWKEITRFNLHTNEGKKQVEFLGVDLLYTAVKYRAPVDLLILINDLLERENGQQLTLDPTLLRKALYYSTTRNDTDVCKDLQSRKWESNERMNVASFLSKKIRYRNHRGRSILE